MTETKPTISLLNQNNDAYAVLGRAMVTGLDAGWTRDELIAFKDEAMSGSYDKLVEAITKHFRIE